MTDPTTDLALELARKVLDGQPFSRSSAPGSPPSGRGAATLELDIREELHQQNGFVHGGVLSYAADNAITFAAGTALGPAVLTSGFSIQYVRPATGAHPRGPRHRGPRRTPPGSGALRPGDLGRRRRRDAARRRPGHGAGGRPGRPRPQPPRTAPEPRLS